ncbi:hypothetical protein CU103_29955 [Phyllobacterium sophorae]|uniref:Uncharacterized protein n=1 Tax=Phyllobacterium sophorae TaxID=1520277 RepID=A0A2P7AQ48_9HYPH|nr:hypothetical protein CU103_29955 [Phyllobacterium sophorae]
MTGLSAGDSQALFLLFGKLLRFGLCAEGTLGNFSFLVDHYEPFVIFWLNADGAERWLFESHFSLPRFFNCRCLKNARHEKFAQVIA